MKGSEVATLGDDGKVGWLLNTVEEGGLQLQDTEASLNLGTGMSWSIICWEANSGNDVTTGKARLKSLGDQSGSYCRTDVD